MEPVAGVHQESLHRLGLALAVFVAVVNGPLLEGPCAVGEAHIVELDLVKAHESGRLQPQLYLVLPHEPAVHTGPVHPADLQRLARLIGDDALRVILRQMGVVEGRDASDDVVPGILQGLDARLIYLQRVVGTLVGGGGYCFITSEDRRWLHRP